jgi:hypothetical protein
MGEKFTMTKQRSKSLAKRSGVGDDPFSHCETLQEFNAALATLSDAQLLDAWERTQGERATRLSDEELLAELDQARREETTQEEL